MMNTTPLVYNPNLYTCVLVYLYAALLVVVYIAYAFTFGILKEHHIF